MYLILSEVSISYMTTLVDGKMLRLNIPYIIRVQVNICYSIYRISCSTVYLSYSYCVNHYIGVLSTTLMNFLPLSVFKPHCWRVFKKKWRVVPLVRRLAPPPLSYVLVTNLQQVIEHESRCLLEGRGLFSSPCVPANRPLLYSARRQAAGGAVQGHRSERSMASPSRYGDVACFHVAAGPERACICFWTGRFTRLLPV